jgi:hypothetical protein
MSNKEITTTLTPSVMYQDARLGIRCLDLLRLASWFGPFRHFVLAHPWDVKGLGNIHPVVVAAVGMWESL